MKRKRNLLKEIIVELSFNEDRLITVAFWVSLIGGFAIGAIVPESKWLMHVEIGGPEQLKWILKGIFGASLGFITLVSGSAVICLIVHVMNEIRYLISK